MNKVAICLVFHNDLLHLERLCRSIKNQSFKNIKIYAIENSESQQSIYRLLETFPDAYAFPYSGNLGFAKGNNILAEKAIEDGCKYLFILNPDMELTENTLSVGVNLMESNEEIAVCSSVILYGAERKKTEIIQLFGTKINYRNQKKTFLFTNQQLNKVNLPSIMEVDFVNGGSMFIRSEIVKKVGLFEEDYFMYNDEIDLAFRIKKLGKKIVVSSETKIFHHHDWSEMNIAGYEFMYYYMMRNRIIYFKKHRFYKFLIFDTIFQILSFPLKFRMFLRIGSISILKYYYLGILKGLSGEKGISSITFS